MSKRLQELSASGARFIRTKAKKATERWKEYERLPLEELAEDAERPFVCCFPGPGVVCLDIDSQDKAAQGLVGSLPPTFTERTPRGFHLWYTTSKPWSRNITYNGQKLEAFCNSKNYVCVAPSPGYTIERDIPVAKLNTLDAQPERYADGGRNNTIYAIVVAAIDAAPNTDWSVFEQMARTTATGIGYDEPDALEATIRQLRNHHEKKQKRDGGTIAKEAAGRLGAFTRYDTEGSDSYWTVEVDGHVLDISSIKTLLSPMHFRELVINKLPRTIWPRISGARWDRIVDNLLANAVLEEGDPESGEYGQFRAIYADFIGQAAADEGLG